MKKVFRLAAIAAIATCTLVACNNNKPAEEVEDTTAIEQVVEEMTEEVAVIEDTVTMCIRDRAPAAVKPVAKKKTATAKPVEKKEATAATTDNNQIATPAGDLSTSTKTTTMKRR